MFCLRYLETPIVDRHLAADTKLYLERVHADEVPHAKIGLVFVDGCNEPVVRVLCVTAYECTNKTVARRGKTQNAAAVCIISCIQMAGVNC